MNNYSRVLAMIALPVLLCLLVGGCGGGGGGLPAIVSLSITPDDFSARNGDVIQFYAFGEQEDGGSRQVTHQVSWQTSDPSVATVGRPLIHRLPPLTLTESSLPWGPGR